MRNAAADRFREDLRRLMSSLDPTTAMLIESRLTARIEVCRKAGMIITEAALQVVVAKLLEELQRKGTISAETRKRLLAGVKFPGRSA